MKAVRYMLTAFCIAAVCGYAEEATTTDTGIQVGQLENGLTYYVKENSFPKGRASLRLFVKAGSIHEEDSQRGLAHFLEHMVFRGSENFEDWEVIEYMKSIGSEFGPHLNAYTHFDHTCYILEIPMENSTALDTSLLVLSDFAGRATLDPAVIEMEREVVMDEMNLFNRQSGGRVGEKLVDELLEGSLFAERLPIGKEEVVRHCDPSEIQKFYNKWYRLDRMAVVVVGDISADETIAKIEKCFGNLKDPETPVEEVDESILQKEPQAIIIEDHELQRGQIGIVSVDKILPDSESIEEDLQEIIPMRIFLHVLDERLDTKKSSVPSPYLNSFIGENGLNLWHKMHYAICIPFEERPIVGFETIVTEIERLRKNGPLQGEVNRAKTALIEEIIEEQSNLDRTTHGEWVSICTDHFAIGSAMHHKADLLQAELDALKRVTPEDVVAWSTSAIDLSDVHVFAALPKISPELREEIESCVPRIQEIVATTFERFEGVEEQSLEVFVDPQEDTNFVVEDHAEAGFKTLTLSNGMKVVLHPSDLEKDIVYIRAVAQGGKTLVSEEFYDSVPKAPGYMLESGFANLDRMQFNNFLTENGIGLTWGIDENSRHISASSPTKNTEALIKTIRALFTEKKFTSDAWQLIYERGMEVDKGIENDPYTFFSLRFRELIYNNHPFYTIALTEKSDQAKAEQISRDLFSDPSEYTIIIVGDFDENEVMDAVSSLWSFPRNHKTSHQAVIPVGAFQTESQNATIEKGENSHSLSMLGILGDFESDHKKDLGLTQQAFNSAISFRILERLRKETGETYGAGALSMFSEPPSLDKTVFLVYFTCEPYNSDELMALAEDEIEKFIKEGISETEVKQEKEKLVQAQKVAVQSNANLVGMHASSVLYGRSYEDFADFDSRLERQLTKERIDSFGRAVLKHSRVKAKLVAESE